MKYSSCPQYLGWSHSTTTLSDTCSHLDEHCRRQQRCMRSIPVHAHSTCLRESLIGYLTRKQELVHKLYCRPRTCRQSRTSWPEQCLCIWLTHSHTDSCIGMWIKQLESAGASTGLSCKFGLKIRPREILSEATEKDVTVKSGTQRTEGFPLYSKSWTSPSRARLK